jgi:TatD DNase family protein
MAEYIDTHSHLQLPQFDTDREAVIARMQERGVVTIAVGVGLITSRQAVALAQDYPDVVVGATIGVHPTDTDEGFDAAWYAGLFTHESPGQKRTVVGVGECGFDYFRTPKAEVYEKQKEVFEAQVAFALEHDLPLMLHVRPSKGTQDAHEDALAILEAKYQEVGGRLRGNAHFFTGSLESAKRYWALGFSTAFPGVVTFAPEYEEIVRACPPDLILSETDAPYASPVPHRGERCEPVYVADTVKALATIRGEDLEELKKRLISNSVRIFGVGQ